MSLLRLKDIGKIYVTGDSVAVGIRGVNLEFDRGEFVAVTGKSGSGKTTLLNVISGMDTYEEGELFIEGEPTSHYSQRDWEYYREKYISFIFQDYNIIESFTVLQNVELALSGIRSRRERRRKALELIERVGLSDYKSHKGSKLSGGQKQRTVIARALAKDSPIILADEPTGNLDSHTAAEIVSLLKEISKDKLVIVVTHSIDQFADYATREIRVFNGQIASDTVLRSSEKVSGAIKDPGAEGGKRITFVLHNGAILGVSRFFAKPKLSAFMILLMFIATFGIFLITASSQSSFSLLSKKNLFTYYPGRGVVIRRDGNAVTEAELEKLKNDFQLESYMRYDAALDKSITKTFENGDNTVNVDFRFSRLGKETPDIGRVPEKAGEAMVSCPISMKKFFGDGEIKTDSLSILSGYSELSIVGVKYYKDNTIPASIVMTDEGLSAVSDALYMSENSFSFNFNHSFYYGEDEIPVFQTSMSSGCQIKVDPDLRGDEIYFTGYISYSLEMDRKSAENMYGDDYELIERVENFIISSDSYSGASSRLNIDVELVSGKNAANDKYEDVLDVLFISSDIMGKILNSFRDNEYLQASLFFVDDQQLYSSLDALGERGYTCVPSDSTYTETEIGVVILSYITVLATIFVWCLLVLFLGVFIYIGSSRSIIANMGDTAILRSMGIKQSEIKISLYVQTLLSVIPAYILVAVLAYVIYSIPATNGLLSYMHLRSYILIALGIFLLDIYITVKYNKKLFKDSVRKTLRGGDGA